MSTFTSPRPTDKFPASSAMAATLRERVHMAGKPTDPALRDFHREVGQRIRAVREQRGMRREDLALAIGVGFKSIVNYETGRPTLERITELAEALEVQPRWLLHGDEGVLDLLAATGDAVEKIALSQALVHERLDGVEAALRRREVGRTGEA